MILIWLISVENMREDKGLVGGGGVVVNRFYYYFQYRVNSARWISVIFRGFYNIFKGSISLHKGGVFSY